MTRLAWLILAWGIIVLTIVDGAYISVVSSYLPHQERQQPNEAKQDKERLNGPVVSLLIEGLDASEGFIERHEKFFIVLFTGAIAYFTYTLWRATDAMQIIANRQLADMKASLAVAEQSATAMKSSVKFARAAYISTHRPKLVVREAYAMKDNDGAIVIVCYTIANSGDTKARIIESAFDTQFEGERSAQLRQPPISVGRNDIGPVELEGGEHYAGECKSSRTTAWPIPDGMDLFFTGHLVYMDERGIKRHMGLRRVYDPVTFRFNRSDGESSQLDYAD
jgi:hypothetical protein